ncbi:uncharacterized protein LOC134180064 [Corticium candelabrum]|uniref:uncharacterized protein LOC134180064 n=1 Tax=Corticium candelabrum TaxID=121492 RepID=UPI002E275E3B|nr:uncharacterized protein LOC134180064 [Corticium candelabrum]
MAAASSMAAASGSEVASSMDLSVLRYSNVWEDHAVLETALNVQPDDDVLSVASCGDNALNLLLAGEPRSVTAIDMSEAQIAVVQLKLAAIRHLPSHRDFLTLLGKDGLSERRLDIYTSLKAYLPSSCSSYFDSRLSLIEDGLASSGRLEKFLAGFPLGCFSKVTQSQVDLLFNSKDLQQQCKIFESFPLDELKKDFLEFNSFDRVARHARHPAQMKYIRDSNYGDSLWLRFVHVATEIPIQTNCYFSWLFNGYTTTHPADPPYLQEKNYVRLRSLVDRVTVIEDTLENHLDQATGQSSFSKANLSDIFEYMSEDHADAVFHLLVSKCRPGGRLAYWNLFTPRQAPDSLMKGQLTSLSEIASRLHSEDRVYFYSSFHVEEVAK